MRVHLKNDGYALSAEFPMTVFEMQDALDKLQIPPETRAVTFQIYDFRNMNLSSELCEKEFTADIFRLNLFVERLENLDDTEMAAMKSLLQTYPESDFEDMLLMTYGLDSVMVYPCEDCRELGETVIENDCCQNWRTVPMRFWNCLTVKKSVSSCRNVRAVCLWMDIIV